MLSLKMAPLPILCKVSRQEDQRHEVCTQGLFLCLTDDKALQQAISSLLAMLAVVDKAKLLLLCSHLSKLLTDLDKTLPKTERKSARQWSKFSMKTKSELKALMAIDSMVLNQWEAITTIRSVLKFCLCTTNRSRWVSSTSTGQDSNWKPTHESIRPRPHFLPTKSNRSIPQCFKRSLIRQSTTNKPWGQVQATIRMDRSRTTIWWVCQWIADRMRCSPITTESEEWKAILNICSQFIS